MLKWCITGQAMRSLDANKERLGERDEWTQVGDSGRWKGRVTRENKGHSENEVCMIGSYSFGVLVFDNGFTPRA